MPNFCVTIKRIIELDADRTEFAQFNIEADSEADAEEQALAMSKSTDLDVEWDTMSEEVHDTSIMDLSVESVEEVD